MSGWDRLRIVVESYEKAAAFPERGNILGDGAMERFHRATGSTLRLIYKLFQKAVEIGTRDDARCIDMKLLALAHAELASPHPDWFNAFSVPVLPPLTKEDTSRRTRLHARKR